MLVGFSVSNYKSFKDGQKISFEASKIVRHKSHVAVKKNKRILKSGLIFGANAGGKSNLVKAIQLSREIVVSGLDKEDGDDVYYLESTNEFVIVSTDGYIRTYFYPSNGKDYFDRQ